MRKHFVSQSGIFNPRLATALCLGSIGITLALFSLTAKSVVGIATPDKSSSPISFRPSLLPPGFSITTRGLEPGASAAAQLRRALTDPHPISSNRQIGSPTTGMTVNSAGAMTIPSVAGIWSIVPSPNGGFAPTSLSAVTCVTASDCWAVGRTEIGQTFANTALLHWDGGSWTVVPSPSVEKQTNGLVDITCTSSSSCWAVGYRIILATVEVKTLTLHWDGASWQIVPSPNVGNGFNALYGIACSSDSNCWAVGFENGGSQAKTLIQKWDGTSWTIQDSPNVGNDHNVLNAVTCLNESACFAVGYSGTAGAKSSLIAKWDGDAWTASTVPNQLLGQENNLASIVCNSTSDCWAVGNSYNGTTHQTLIEQWNGTAWSSVVSPNIGADNYLARVTCSSASDCWAVGYSSNAAIDPSLADQDLVLHWNGTVWLPNTDLLDPAATYAGDLAGVTCAQSSQCWAVGSLHPSGSGRPQIARWDGVSWAPATAPDVPAKPSSFLHGITCVSSSDCWAIGFNFYGNVARSQIMHWDGSTWELRSSPNTALDRNNYLGEVTCISTSDCWTVGSSTDSIGVLDQALSMHWDGSAWAIVDVSPVDTSQAAETSLEGVACNSSSDCWAVGYSTIQDYQAMIQHWNGSAWMLVPTPPMPDPTSRSIFYDVTCTGTSDCTAVGVQWTSPLTGSALYQTLVAHWNGTTWSVVSSPNTSPDEDNILSAVTCVSPTQCWAVGSSNNYSQALIERWDGTSWSMVAAPQSGSILNAIACSSASDCWAAGPYYTPDPPAQTLLMHWDGASWTAVVSPNTNASDSNYLAGIACPSSSECWAVGQYWRKGVPQTLTLHYLPLASALKITSITRLTESRTMLTGFGVPNQINTIKATSNLSQQFESLGTVVPDSYGMFEFEDPNTAGMEQRFYRLTYP